MFTIWENHDAKHAYRVLFSSGDAKAAMLREVLILSTSPKTDAEIRCIAPNDTQPAMDR